MASQSVPPHDDTVGPTILYVLIPLFVVAFITFVLRIGSRLFPKARLTAADWTIAVAMVTNIVAISLVSTSIAKGFGRHNYYLGDEDKASIGKHNYAVFLLGLFTSCFSRISVACLLLQFPVSRTWKYILWATIGFQALLLFVSEIVEILQCRPVRAMWEPVPDAKCFTAAQMWAHAYAFIGIAMFSDIMLAIMPMFVIWRLSRSPVEKALVSFLMASGLFAAATGIFKAYYVKTFDITSPDTFRQMIPAFLWCRIEETVLIITACVPLLKGPIEHTLHRIGFPTFNNYDRKLNSIRPDLNGSSEDDWGTARRSEERKTSEA